MLLHKELLVLFPVVSFLSELLVCSVDFCQLALDLLDEAVSLGVPTHLAVELLKQALSLLQLRVVSISNLAHLELQLPKVFIVVIRLVIVLIDAHDVVLFALLMIHLNLINPLLVLVQLIRQHLVVQLLLLENEVQLSFLAVQVLERLDWELACTVFGS